VYTTGVHLLLLYPLHTSKDLSNNNLYKSKNKRIQYTNIKKHVK